MFFAIGICTLSLFWSHQARCGRLADVTKTLGTPAAKRKFPASRSVDVPISFNGWMPIADQIFFQGIFLDFVVLFYKIKRNGSH